MQNTSPLWNWMWADGGKALPSEEYSGPVVSFNNPGYTYPKSVVVSIDPVQDLHGYDHPWPAGGGKNKLQVTATSQTIRGVTFTVNDDGTITANGTATANIVFTVAYIDFASGSYLLNGTPSGGSTSTYYIRVYNSNTQTPKNSTTRDVPFAAEEGFNRVDIRVLNGVSFNNLVFKPMIRLASETDATFAPYSNICAITGWTGANVVVSPTTDARDGTTYHILWETEAGTIYGATLGVTTGVLTVTDANIESYAGESLPSTWISSMDVYSEGGTPTTGAQVVYKLATPQTYHLTPTEVSLLLGVNNVWADTGDITIVLQSPDTRLETRATIAGTVYTEMSNPVIARALTQYGMTVGNAVSATCQVSIMTEDTIPRAASVVIEQRLNDGTTASEWLPAGTFYISRRTRDAATGILTLECYDALLKANAIWEPASSTTWPQAMGNAATALADLLGVALDSRTSIRTGAAYVIEKPDAGTTIHDVLSLIAAANGGNWIITPANKLRLVPVVSAAGAASATENVIDVTGVTGAVMVHTAAAVTGIRYQADNEPVVLGDETGIVIDADVGAAIASDLYDDMIGMTYQAYSLSGAIYDPAAELGDWVRGGANGEVSGVLYAETATLALGFRGDISAPESGEMADEYPYIGASAKALTAAKVYAAQQVAALDGSLDQASVFNRLTGNGAAQGIYLSNGQLYVNASYIQAGTLSANLIFGGVLTLGGSNDSYGMIRLLNADGSEYGNISNNGVGFENGNSVDCAINYGFTPGSANKTHFVSRHQSGNTKNLLIIDDGKLDLYDTYSVSQLAFTNHAHLEPTRLYLLGGGSANSDLLLEGFDEIPQTGGNPGEIIVINTPASADLTPRGLTIQNDHDGAWFNLNRLSMNYSGALTLGTPLGIASGGTGATTAAAALAALGGVATGDIIDNLTSTATDKPLSAAQGKKLATIGEIISGTNASNLTVPTGAWTEISSVSLTPGAWIITGHAGLSTSYNDVVQIRLASSNNTLVRFSGVNGGGAMTVYIFRATSNTSVPLQMYQASGSDKTASNVAVVAVRVGL